MDYIFTKSDVSVSKLQAELVSLLGSLVDGVSFTDPELIIHTGAELSLENYNIMNAIVSEHHSVETDKIILLIIKDAEIFGEKLVYEFKITNILLGIYN